MGSSKSCLPSCALGRLGKEPSGSFFHSLLLGILEFGVVASDDFGVAVLGGEKGPEDGVLPSGLRNEGIGGSGI